MPIYEYVCDKCDEVFSVYQSINADAQNIKCPKCGSDNVKKKISAFSCCAIGSGSSSVSGSYRGFGGG